MVYISAEFIFQFCFLKTSFHNTKIKQQKSVRVQVRRVTIFCLMVMSLNNIRNLITMAPNIRCVGSDVQTKHCLSSPETYQMSKQTYRDVSPPVNNTNFIYVRFI